MRQKIPGSKFIGESDHENYRLELYVLLGVRRHVIVYPKHFDADGKGVKLEGFIGDANRLCVQHFGKPADTHHVVDET